MSTRRSWETGLATGARRAKIAAVLALVCCAMCFSVPVLAQGSGGTVNGTITDPSGAAIPKADVILVHQDTGAVRTILTNDRGFFSVPNLVSGRYDLTVAATGFATAVQEGVSVDVGSTVVANIRMQISSVEEKVDVVAATADIALSSSTLSTVVKGDVVRELPLNGRDWTMMATLEPGVHAIEAQADLSGGGNARANRGWGTQMSFGGNRPQQNNYRLDGISINDYSGGGPGGVLGSVLGVDAIGEFSVVTGNASADYGKTSGGVINAVTRSGSNDFHGSAYGFFRNDAFDAPNYFDDGEKPDFYRNQYGAALGGPVVKNKLFFFADFEGLRQDLGTTDLITVPSVAAREGRLESGAVTVSPLVAPYLGIYPLPNRGESGDVGTYSFVSNSQSRDDLYTARVDYNPSASAMLHGSFLVDRSHREGPNESGGVIVGATSNRAMGSLEYTRIFSSNLVSVSRVGFSSSESHAPEWIENLNPLFDDLSLGSVPGNPMGTIEVSGLTGVDGGKGGVGESFHSYKSLQIYNDLIWTKGVHVIKVGVAFERNYYDTTTSNAPNGRWVFGSLRSFLTNQPTSFTASIQGKNPTMYLAQNVFGVYVADDFRVRPNLTLNLGLRYEPVGLPTEKEDRFSNLDNITDPAPRIGSPYFNNPTKWNISPRLGFAWDPFSNGKTAIRGGVGVYDTLPLLYQFSLLIVNTQPFFRTGTLTGLKADTFPTAAYGMLTANDTRAAYIQKDPDRSYVTQWNVNVERQLPASFVVHVGYVGQHGVHQPFRTNDSNIVVPERLPDGSLQWPLPLKSGKKLNPNVGVINTLLWIGKNDYNALNVGLRRQAGGLRAGVSYTYGKSTDLSSSSTAGSNFNNSIVGPISQFPDVMKGRSDFDVRHNLVLNAVYTLPSPGAGGGIAKALTDGWQISGIYKIQSGLPFSAAIGGDSVGMLGANSFNFADRLTTPGCESAVNPGDPNHYIKTECLAFPAPGRMGNSGRNSLEGPGIKTLDASLVKMTRIKGASLQVRLEMFNVLNRANFAVPNRTVSQIFNAAGRLNANAGKLISTSTTARQMQLGAKLSW